jgi:hypothetical protein
MNIGGVESPKVEMAVNIVNWLSTRSLGTVTVLGRVSFAAMTCGEVHYLGMPTLVPSAFHTKSGGTFFN